jgi:hypothetical protein
MSTMSTKQSQPEHMSTEPRTWIALVRQNGEFCSFTVVSESGSLEEARELAEAAVAARRRYGHKDAELLFLQPANQPV